MNPRPEFYCPTCGYTMAGFKRKAHLKGKPHQRHAKSYARQVAARTQEVMASDKDFVRIETGTFVVTRPDGREHNVPLFGQDVLGNYTVVIERSETDALVMQLYPNEITRIERVDGLARRVIATPAGPLTRYERNVV